MPFWTNQKILVAGGTGLIGIPLVRLLEKLGAKVKVAAINNPFGIRPEITELTDLTDYQNCLRVTEGMDYVFNLTCIKGSPQAMKEHPAKFFDILIPLSTALGRASLSNGVGGYLFTSSVAVYQPAETLFEDDVWKTMPSKNDWFAGWAKRMGELQVEAYRIEHNWTNTAIVRPSNVYGPFDNFDPGSALFIANKIRQFAKRENPIIVWGDGSQVRDFIHSEDAARGILLAAEKGAGPVNLCSGRSTTIKEVMNILARNADYKPEIIFDISKPAGDQKRLLDTKRLETLGFKPEISLEAGILETQNWLMDKLNLS
jgi:GDP-L-fucose synthase